MKRNQGFTMVELLVVLVIIGILAAVATPLFFKNTQKARASEAIATMGLIRQALREHKINTTKWIEVNNGDLRNAPEDATKPGLDINIGTAQYFSNKAFSVKTTNLGDFENFVKSGNPPAQDFVIKVDASDANNPPCKDKILGHETDCALKQDEVKNYLLEMDNSGRIFISYDADKGESKKWVNY